MEEFGTNEIHSLDELKDQYEGLEWDVAVETEESIRSEWLISFPYEYQGSDSIVAIDTDEFTAVCPWTGLPDFGNLKIEYNPSRHCLELKSLKYYLLSYRDVGIVQEHAANRILKDLVRACDPVWMTIYLDYKTRGGIHTTVEVKYGHE
ncbi:MAG: NADPH-dependent 7-cyano-7-deazaguanine reductase QueF [Chloroflexi bacterium]|nr:NADPH-dependent 7-cyano-7-deazaguanine reductase QueF [Chloroflexota bacterium]|tara:strand:+ start:5344 stop:5790 length:447 start_codon:yes stop_codon:yes gene_type:complete